MILVNAIVSFWDTLRYLIVLFCISLILNYLSGVIVAVKGKRRLSRSSFTGGWRVVGSMLAIVVGGLLDLLIEFLNIYFDSVNFKIDNIPLFCCLALVWSIASELASIAKNARKLGHVMPKFLESVIARLKETIEETSDSTGETDDGGTLQKDQ